MAKDTKQRILNSALKKFNELGYINVRLQHIADDAQMSIGNMAYHFQHKIEMFKILYENWRSAQYLVFADIHLTPVFANFDIYLRQSFRLQQQYRFVFLDQLELIRMSKEAESSYHEYFQSQEEQIAILLALYEARGAVDLGEQDPQVIALSIRRVIDNWMILQLIEARKPKDELEEFCTSVWAEIQPYFTASGLEEFEAITMQTSN